MLKMGQEKSLSQKKRDRGCARTPLSLCLVPVLSHFFGHKKRAFLGLKKSAFYFYLTNFSFYDKMYQLFLCFFGGSKMFVSFGHRLRALGGMRVGFRMKGSTGCLMVGIYAFMNFFVYLLWYTLLGTFWLMYGMCYLFFYLPAKGIIKLCKKKKQEKEIAEAASKYTAPTDEK